MLVHNEILNLLNLNQKGLTIEKENADGLMGGIVGGQSKLEVHRHTSLLEEGQEFVMSGDIRGMWGPKTGEPA